MATVGGALNLPSQFGRYTLLERLALGGMAEVFRAKISSSHGFEKILVIKRILPHLAVFIINEVLEALDYAHNARDMEGKTMHIVHRDISPSNIFLSKRGDVKLGDFGIAHAQRRESKTQAGTLKGKYGYMSPEQVVGHPIDGRSDLFAVGVVLAEMLMGRRLFTAPNDLDVLLMVRDARVERF